MTASIAFMALAGLLYYMPHQEAMPGIMESYLPPLPLHCELSRLGCATSCLGLFLVINPVLFLMHVQPEAGPVCWHKLTQGLPAASALLVILTTPVSQNHNTHESRIIIKHHQISFIPIKIRNKFSLIQHILQILIIYARSH